MSSYAYCAVEWPKTVDGYVELSQDVWSLVRERISTGVAGASRDDLEDIGWGSGDEDSDWRQVLETEFVEFLDEALADELDDCAVMCVGGVRFLVSGGEAEYGAPSDSYPKLVVCSLLGLFNTPL